MPLSMPRGRDHIAMPRAVRAALQRQIHHGRRPGRPYTAAQVTATAASPPAALLWASCPQYGTQDATTTDARTAPRNR